MCKWNGEYIGNGGEPLQLTENGLFSDIKQNFDAAR